MTKNSFDYFIEAATLTDGSPRNSAPIPSKLFEVWNLMEWTPTPEFPLIAQPLAFFKIKLKNNVNTSVDN